MTTAFVTVFLLAGCGGGSDAEPNDQIGQAGKVEVGEPFTLTIQPEGDRDWFRVEAPGPGYLDVQSGGASEDLDVRVAFAQHEQWAADKENWMKDWSSPPSAARVPEAGSYHFAVKDAGNNDASGEPIELRVRYLERFDEHEVNDSPDDALKIEPGSVFELAIFPRGEEDWFRVDVPARRYLEAQVREVPDGLDPRFRFVRHDEWQDKQTELRGWNSPPTAVFVVDSGPVWVEVKDAGNDDRSEKRIKARFRLVGDMDPGEPNDDAAHATPFGPGDRITAAIFPEGDEDHFRTKLAEGEILGVRTVGEVPGSLDLRVALARQAGNGSGNLNRLQGWTELPAEFKAPGEGEYFLLLKDAGNDDRSGETFQLLSRIR